MTTRCRWHEDPGRCQEPVAAPGVPAVPEFCVGHLHRLIPWARTQATMPADGDAWIHWAARRAADVDQELRALGYGTIRTPRAPERR